jgi:hypothetical protein
MGVKIKQMTQEILKKKIPSKQTTLPQVATLIIAF